MLWQLIVSLNLKSGNWHFLLPLKRYLLAHLSCQAHKVSLWYTCIPMIWRLFVVRLSSVQHFQRSFPKPLGQSKPNFMWSLYWKGERTFCINGPGHMTKMAASPIYGKAFKNLILLNQKLERIHISFCSLLSNPFS